MLLALTGPRPIALRQRCRYVSIYAGNGVDRDAWLVAVNRGVRNLGPQPTDRLPGSRCVGQRKKVSLNFLQCFAAPMRPVQSSGCDAEQNAAEGGPNQHRSVDRVAERLQRVRS